MRVSAPAGSRIGDSYRPYFHINGRLPRPKSDRSSGPLDNQEKSLLFALRFHFPIERGHADAEHARGLFARTTAMVQSGVDISAFLLLDEFVQGLANWHRSDGLLGFLTLCGCDNLWRQISRQNFIFVAQCARTLYRVLKLAHVSRVIVVTENIDSLRINLLRFSAGCARVFLQEVVHEQRNIFKPLPQWRDFDWDDCQPVIKVFAERAVLHFALQNLVGCPDDPNIHRNAQVVGATNE